MTDNALEKALQIRAEMQQMIERLEAELATVREQKARADRFIAEYHTFMGLDTEVDSKAHTAHIPTPILPKPVLPGLEGNIVAKTRKRPKNPPKEEVAEEAVRIILEREEPMMRDELFKALSERGVQIEGKDPRMVLSTMLWRQADKILRLKGGGYWPTEAPLPEGAEPASRSSE